MTDNLEDPSGQGPLSPNELGYQFTRWLTQNQGGTTFLAGSIPGSKSLRKVGRFSRDKMLAMPDDERHHISPASYPPGEEQRVENHIDNVFASVFDDVGTIVEAPPGSIPITKNKINIDEDYFHLYLPTPSWVTETSLGCHQYGYAFKPALTLVQARIFHEQLKKHPVLGIGLHSIGQYMRLPSGSNTKPDGGGFKTRLVSWSKVTYTAEEFAKAFGLSMVMPRTSTTRQLAGATSAPSVTDREVITEVTLAEILKNHLPNDNWFDSRDKWIRTGHAIFGATNGQGKEVFDQWSSTHPSYDTADTDMAWDSFDNAKASASTIRRMIEERWGRDSDHYLAAAGAIAFDPDNAPPMAPPIGDDDIVLPAGAGDKAKLDELLAEISKLQGIPKIHQENPANVLENVFDLTAQALVAPPFVFPPYMRGKLSVIFGPPGSGKSLLLQQQAMAVAFNRPDLIRYGADPLQLTGDVLFFANEDGKQTFTSRTAGWLKHHKLDPKAQPAKNWVAPIVSNILSRKADGSIQHQCQQILESILDHLRKGNHVSMIVIDTLPASTEGFEENSATDMTIVINFLKRLADSFWASIVFVAHGTKASWNGSNGDADRSIASLRGSGAIGGAVRGAVTIASPNKEEKKCFDNNAVAEGRIHLEIIAKSSAGRQGYMACAYERILVDLDVTKADGSGQMVMQLPVLIPITMKPQGFDDETILEGFRQEIEDWLTAGEEVRSYGHRARTQDPLAIHVRWNVEPKIAHERLSKILQRNWFKVEASRDSHVNREFDKVVWA